jgi:MFS family permease
VPWRAAWRPARSSGSERPRWPPPGWQSRRSSSATPPATSPWSSAATARPATFPSGARSPRRASAARRSAWGLVPLYLAAHGASAGEIGLVAALYPGVWGAGQIATGWISDHAGRKPLIVAGMLVQAGALGLLAAGGGTLAPAVAAAALLGVGTALVYPTLIAAVSDAVPPAERAPVVGVYRFWRDAGFVVGALLAGAAADALGFGAAIALVAALTAASGLWVAATRWSAAAPRLGGAPAASG